MKHLSILLDRKLTHDFLNQRVIIELARNVSVLTRLRDFCKSSTKIEFDNTHIKPFALKRVLIYGRTRKC